MTGNHVGRVRAVPPHTSVQIGSSHNATSTFISKEITPVVNAHFRFLMLPRIPILLGDVKLLV